MKSLFIAVDGDDVGRKIEFFVVMNQMDSLSHFFKNFQSSMLWLANKLENNYDAEIIINGGDSILAEVRENKFSISKLENLRNEFAILSNVTLSFGLGKTPRQAYFALKLAKASGKNRIEVFKEL